ncbi:MAG: hypothetical protein JRH20_30760, partial [Deltaproteobacteria bacterium]|nr:hypothetical protein [Deltaproteobacteria bacterium]
MKLNIQNKDKVEGLNLRGRQLTLSNMRVVLGEGGFVGLTPSVINNTLAFLGRKLPRF